MVNRTDRAKQFLPFDALKGLQEALREKEVENEEKRELSEESLIELENKFNEIEKGNIVKVRFYKCKKYVEIVGKITNIDFIKKKVQINKTQNINVSAIIDIVKLMDF